MKVIIDLNVVLDIHQNHTPLNRSSSKALSMARTRAIEALIPNHAVTTVYYVVAKVEAKLKADFGVDWQLTNL